MTRAALRTLAVVGLAVASVGPLSAQEPATALVAQDAVTVVLANPGAEPRAELRYDLASMRPTDMVMDMTMSMTMSNPMMGEQSVDLPTMRMNMGLTNMTLNEQGHLRMDFAFRSMEVLATEGTDPGMVAAMQGAMAGMESVTGYSVIDDRGNVIDSDFDASGAPAAVQQQMGSMRDSLKQMVAPLPVEPVGVGATWSITTEVASNGLTIQQTASYTLRERTANAVGVDVTLQQSAAQQQIADPNLPPGVSIFLDSYTASGGGAATIPLNSPVPNSSANVESSMSMAMDDGSGTRVPYMSMQMRMQMVIAPVAPAAP